MSEQNIKLTGSELLNPHLDNYNFIATMADGLLYLPNSDGTETTGLAQVKFDAMGGTAPLWKDVRYNLSLQDVTTPDNPIVDFNMLVSLYGITDGGNVELVGEDVISTPSTTLTSSLHVFDLLTSACHSKFFTTNDTGTNGNITLKLPFRTDYIENIGLHVENYSGWKRLKTVPVLGNASAAVNIPVLITVPYDPDMNSDFSDIRFIDWDGNLLDYGLIAKTDSSTATFLVKLATIPASGVTNYVTIWYKKGDATSQATDINNLYTYYDTFEDNLKTGRTSPLTDLWQNGGTLSITNTNPISGLYSLKHIGTGYANTMGWAYSGRIIPSTTSIEFEVKLITQGTGANTPYISPLYFQYTNSSNWGRIATWYDGTYQKIGLQKNVSGTISNYGTQTIQTGKWAAGTTKHIRILRSAGSSWGIQVDGGSVLYVTGNPGFTEVWGGAAQMDSQALWDNIKVYPYIGTVPTLGTLSAEKQAEYGGTWDYTDVSPDALTTGSQQVLFTTPAMDTNAQSYITYKEYGNTILTGNKFRINNGGVIKQGYNGLDAYKSLILRFEVDTNSNYTVKVNSAEANYEV